MSIITVPFSWLLLKLYEFSANYGVAIILFALTVKIILLPFQMKSKRSMMRTSRLAPRLKALEKKHEGNKQKYQEEVAKLYKEEKINPMSGCIWTLIPFPILIALYSVIRQPLTKMMGLTAEQVTKITDYFVSSGLYEIPKKANSYSEITITELIHQFFEPVKQMVPEVMDINYNFLGLNLGHTPNFKFFLEVDWSTVSSWLPALGLFLIPVISAMLSYFSMIISNKANPQTAEQQGSMKSMMYTMPLVSLWIGFVMPAALGIYWIFNSAFSIIQDAILTKRYNRIMDIEDAERLEREKAKEEEIERKRQETEKLRAEGNTNRNPNTSKRKIQATEKAREEERLAAAAAAERAEKRAAMGLSDDMPESQVGNRRYARGRAYVKDRFTNPEGADEATAKAALESEDAPSIDIGIEEVTSQPETVNPAGFVAAEVADVGTYEDVSNDESAMDDDNNL